MKIKIERILLVLLMLMALVFFSGCVSKKWTGFYYPSGVSGETIYSLVNEFSTYEDCMSWVRGQSDSHKNPESEDWSCGKKCKLTEDYKYLIKNYPEGIKKLSSMGIGPMYVCSETK